MPSTAREPAQVDVLDDVEDLQEADEILYVVKRRAVRAFPHTSDPEFEHVVDDLEWGFL